MAWVLTTPQRFCAPGLEFASPLLEVAGYRKEHCKEKVGYSVLLEETED